jgi:hypothetical protein
MVEFYVPSYSLRTLRLCMKYLGHAETQRSQSKNSSYTTSLLLPLIKASQILLAYSGRKFFSK